jgi:hypothetical protein
MASFDWRFGTSFIERYFQPELDVQGVELWLEFIRRIASDDREDGRRRVQLLNSFISNLQNQPVRSVEMPRVFISHRQVDVGPAERIAYIASQVAGLEYWLDVHDPTLANLPIPPQDPRYPLIVAATIEIALLNCTHIIAAHTPNSLTSKWIPYEFGRAKARAVISNQAAGWFHSAIHPMSFGEYVLLADMLGTDSSVEGWLLRHAPRPIVPRLFLRPPPPPLP